MVSENVSYNDKLLLFLLRKGLNTECSEELFDFLREPDWNAIYKVSTDNGVLAIVYDGLLSVIKDNKIPKKFQPPHNLILQWSLNVMEIEKLYAHQYLLANELADAYAEQNIKTVVLKGIVASKFYPKPNHRPCGDLDCFLMGNYNKGNQIAEDLGAKVDITVGSLHSRIYYKGLMIENHETCIDILGRKKNKIFEEILEKELKETMPAKINDTNLLSPSILFNALFLTVHSWKHFKNHENVKLRHICDWALFLKLYVDKLDWKEYETLIQIRDSKLLHFAECFSVIAHKYIGAPLPDIFEENGNTVKLSEKVFKSILHEDSKHIPGGFFKGKYFILKNLLVNSWRKKEFCEDTFLYRLYGIKFYIISYIKKHLHI